MPVSTSSQISAARGGWFVGDGRPRPFVTADYPYYRDDPGNWADRLAALVRMRVDAVTTYVPWRHHQPSAQREPDLTGTTDPRRDVVRFVRLAAGAGLSVVVKPGPFIHAETNYGGLPDWVSPIHDSRIEPVLDASGAPRTWSGSQRGPDGKPVDWPLPAPLCPVFDELVLSWLRAVGEQLVRPHSAQDGPIVAVQIANEGIYTDGALGLWSMDFSASALAAHHRLHAPLGGRPPSAPTTGAAEVDPLHRVAWGHTQAERFAELFRRWSATVGAAVPTVVNVNPPAAGPGALDSWLARTQPWRWAGVRYGFTNWVGPVAENDESRARYVLAAKLAPGCNYEENWGFSVLYEKAFADPATCLHQTVLALACGATGYNLYTGVATSTWDADLDRFHDRPYPDCAPIGADGVETEKVTTARALADYLRRHGTEWSTGHPVRSAVIGYWAPHAAAAAWHARPEGRANHGPLPVCGEFLRAWHDAARTHQLDFGLWDLDDPDTDPADAAGRASGRVTGIPLVVPTWRYLPRLQQRLLASHVAEGGRLVLVGEMPGFDLHGRSCLLLDDVVRAAAPDRVLHLPGPSTVDAAVAAARRVAGWAPPAARVVEGVADVYLRRCPADVDHLAVLASADGGGTVRIETSTSHRVTLDLCAGGAALVRLAGGVVTDALVTGRNDHLGSSVTPSVTAGGVRFAAPHGTLLNAMATTRRQRVPT